MTPLLTQQFVMRGAGRFESNIILERPFYRLVRISCCFICKLQIGHAEFQRTADLWKKTLNFLCTQMFRNMTRCWMCWWWRNSCATDQKNILFFQDETVLRLLCAPLSHVNHLMLSVTERTVSDSTNKQLVCSKTTSRKCCKYMCVHSAECYVGSW